MDPTCANGCLDELNTLPPFVFDRCAPQVNYGNVNKLYLGIPGNPFTSITSLSEWTTRLASNTATRIIALTVDGDRPRVTGTNTRPISDGRTIALPIDRAVNFDIDETSDANHEAVRQMQCGGNYLVWYGSGKHVYGGNEGLLGFVDIDLNNPRSREDVLLYQGTFTWKSKFMEERSINPVA